MDQILFGSVESSLPSSWEERIDMLHNASFLAIDQYNGNGSAELSELNSYGVVRIPDNISEINFQGNSTHRQYTHMGWDHTYFNDRANWNTRKYILINTVGKVFNFSTSWDSNTHHFEYNQRAISMAAFIYYIHLLGDYQQYYEEYPNATQSANMLPLVSGATGTTSVISEIKIHLQVICSEQVNSNVFNGFMTELTQCDSRIYNVIYSSTGGLTDEQYEELNDAVDGVIEVLIQYVPDLLRNESFFDNTFPENGEESSGFWDWVPWNKNH